MVSSRRKGGRKHGGREALSEVDDTRRRLYDQRRMQEKSADHPPTPLPWVFGRE